LTQDDDPLISVITVNFNGRKFLNKLFSSILNLNYSPEKLQVIMVDNNSMDGSVRFVKKKFPQVEIISLKENKGYAGGNNEGFKHSKGRYIALINNDCVVDQNWLCEMISIFKQSADNSRIGAVGSKVVFYYQYLPLQMITSSKNGSGAYNSKKSRRLGIKVYDVIVGDAESNNGEGAVLNESIKYLDGFYPQETDENGENYRWTRDSAIMALPIENISKDMDLQFKVSSYLSPNNLQLVAGEEIIGDIKVSRKAKIIRLKIPKKFFSYRKDIINSCGIKINRSFYSMDRGFESFDEGQYSRVEEVFGLSGSSFIMDRKMLEDIGCFNGSFFTYYEDIDLFWRSRLAGWKNFFTPKSLVRHFHCGTSKEWSHNFIYYVVKNRLLMIFRCGWTLLFVRSYAAFVLSNIINVISYMTGMLKGRRQNRIDIPIRIKIFFELFYLLPRNLPDRIKIRRNNKIQDKSIKSWIKNF